MESNLSDVLSSLSDVTTAIAKAATTSNDVITLAPSSDLISSNVENDVVQAFTNDTSNVTDPYSDFFGPGMGLHKHWQMYAEEIESIPSAVFYGLGMYIAFVGLIGTLGNFLVIWIFATTKSLRTPPNMYIINMAISDMLFSAVNGFPLMTIASFQKKWKWGALACTLYGYLGGIFGMVSINTLAVISTDRYMVIAKPFYAMKHASCKRSLMQIAFVWMLSFLWVTPPLFGFGTFIPEGFQVECSFDYLSRDWGTLIFNHAMFWCGFVVPVVITIFSYVKIVGAVGSQGKEMKKTAEKMGAKDPKDERARKQEIQTTKIAAVSISLFVLSWLPYALVAQLGVWNMAQFVTPYTTQLPVMFAKASAMWNPILYALSHPRFRAQLDERFPMLVCCAGRNMDKDTPSTASTKKVTKAAGGKKRLERSESEISNATEAENIPTVDMKPGATTSPPPRPATPKTTVVKSEQSSSGIVVTTESEASGASPVPGNKVTKDKIDVTDTSESNSYTPLHQADIERSTPASLAPLGNGAGYRDETHQSEAESSTPVQTKKNGLSIEEQVEAEMKKILNAQRVSTFGKFAGVFSRIRQFKAKAMSHSESSTTLVQNPTFDTSETTQAYSPVNPPEQQTQTIVSEGEVRADFVDSVLESAKDSNLSAPSVIPINLGSDSLGHIGESFETCQDISVDGAGEDVAFQPTPAPEQTILDVPRAEIQPISTPEQTILDVLRAELQPPPASEQTILDVPPAELSLPEMPETGMDETAENIDIASSTEEETYYEVVATEPTESMFNRVTPIPDPRMTKIVTKQGSEYEPDCV